MNVLILQKDFTKYGQHFFSSNLFFENNLQKTFTIRKAILKQQLEIGLYNGTTCSQFQKKIVLGQQIYWRTYLQLYSKRQSGRGFSNIQSTIS
jgi:hypothetical protein